MRLSTRLSILILLCSTVACAQDWAGLTLGTPEKGPRFSDQFGNSVSVDNNIAVIGAPLNDDANVNAGKAFVYEFFEGQWKLTAELVSNAPDENIQMGRTVLVRDGIILVGVPNYNGNANKEQGCVLVYKKTSEGWTLTQQLLNVWPSPYEHFGSSLAMHNGVVVVGAPGPDVFSENSGAVYLFNNIDFERYPSEIIRPPQSEPTYKFGVSVAINATDIFIGDTRSTVNSRIQGAAFVLDRASLQVKAKLSTSSNIFLFGYNLVAADNEVAVASYGENENLSYGSVFLYIKSPAGWTDKGEDRKLIPANNTDYGIYGQSMHLDDRVFAIGSWGSSDVDFFDKPATGWMDIGTPFSLKNPIPIEIARYGYSLSIYDNHVMIGAPNWNVANTYSGAVFTYQRSGQSFSTLSQTGILKKLSSNASGDQFGFSVDIDGIYAVAGAPYESNAALSSGAAYVFKLQGSEWVRIAKLTPSDPGQDYLFGYDVAIHKNTVVVSSYQASPSYDNGTYTSGKVYVFEKQGSEWSSMNETAVIERLDRNIGGNFGYAVDVFENDIAISHLRDGSPATSGIVYIFSKNPGGWSKIARLMPSPYSYSQFGQCLVMSKDVVVVGAPSADNIGAVLVFEKPVSGWSDISQSAVLRSADARAFSYFGRSVAIKGNTILVGAEHFYSGSTGAGYIFEKDGTWKNATENAILLPREKIVGAGYGASVALGEDYAVLGATSIYGESGLAIFFRKVDGIWKNTVDYQEAGSFNFNDRYSFSMASDGDIVMIGAPGVSTIAGGNSGGAFFLSKQPTILRVSSTNDDGVYKVDDRIQIKIVYSQPVNVTGNPTLKIQLNNDRFYDLPFKGLSNDRELNFEYIVVEGDFRIKLDYKDVNSLQLPSASISSKLNLAPAVTSLAEPGRPGSLSAAHSLTIDGTPPPVEVVGIEDDLKAMYRAYPNPFIDEFRIESEEDVSVTLLTSTGVRVYSASLGKNQICKPEISSGVYILEIRTKDGKSRRSKLIRR